MAHKIRFNVEQDSCLTAALNYFQQVYNPFERFDSQQFKIWANDFLNTYHNEEHLRKIKSERFRWQHDDLHFDGDHLLGRRQFFVLAFNNFMGIIESIVRNKEVLDYDFVELKRQVVPPLAAFDYVGHNELAIGSHASAYEED